MATPPVSVFSPSPLDIFYAVQYSVVGTGCAIVTYDDFFTFWSFGLSAIRQSNPRSGVVGKEHGKCQTWLERLEGGITSTFRLRELKSSSSASAACTLLSNKSPFFPCQLFGCHLVTWSLRRYVSQFSAFRSFLFASSMGTGKSAIPSKPKPLTVNLADELHHASHTILLYLWK